MSNLDTKTKQILLDSFGKNLISDVRDVALSISMGIVKQTTMNQNDLERYRVFSELTVEEKEKVCDLLSETITDTIYRFLEMFEEHEELMEINLICDESKYDMKQISEKMGSEVVCCGNEGWIQRFSKIGRFVL